MLIKGTTRKGDPIPMDARGALKAAVERLCKAVNTLETVYWVDKRTIKETKFQSLVDKDGKWEAWAEGTANIGKTDAKTNHFHKPRPHTFKVHYRLAKDEWGIPDIEIVSPPEFAAIDRNPWNSTGPIPVPPPQVTKKVSKKAAEEQIK